MKSTGARPSNELLWVQIDGLVQDRCNSSTLALSNRNELQSAPSGIQSKLCIACSILPFCCCSQWLTENLRIVSNIMTWSIGSAILSMWKTGKLWLSFWPFNWNKSENWKQCLRIWNVYHMSLEFLVNYSYVFIIIIMIHTYLHHSKFLVYLSLSVCFLPYVCCIVRSQYSVVNYLLNHLAF